MQNNSLEIKDPSSNLKKGDAFKDFCKKKNVDTATSQLERSSKL